MVKQDVNTTHNIMAQALKTDLLLQCVGISVKNHKGEPMGKIVEVKRSGKRQFVEYLILQCDTLYGRERFFAIPASTILIKITESGEIILKADKKDLTEANRIPYDQCPKPNFQVYPSIFELYEYQPPTLILDKALSSIHQTI